MFSSKVENNQFINLTTTLEHSGCKKTNKTTGKAQLHCKGIRNFNTARDRWWFVAVSNCNSTKGIQLQ